MGEDQGDVGQGASWGCLQRRHSRRRRRRRCSSAAASSGEGPAGSGWQHAPQLLWHDQLLGMEGVQAIALAIELQHEAHVGLRPGGGGRLGHQLHYQPQLQGVQLRGLGGVGELLRLLLLRLLLLLLLLLPLGGWGGSH